MRFDHILLMGYGAPAESVEVEPYLRAMSRGRDIPEERLKTLAVHYDQIGGASPYNAQVLDFRNRLEKELTVTGTALPVFCGMMHWHPQMKEAVSWIFHQGLRKGLAVPLTPYRSAAAGAGYRKHLESICAGAELSGLAYEFLEGWQGKDAFLEAEAEEISRALGSFSPEERADVSVLFSFHSLPVCADPADPLSDYDTEARATVVRIAERLGHSKWSVVYQSRPVSTRGSWLGPEIEAEILALAAKGEKRVLVAPLGFLCDNAEVLYDLDHAARQAAEGCGMKYLRARTVLHQPRIAELLRALIQEFL